MTQLFKDPLLAVTRKLLGFLSAACFVLAGLLLFIGVLGLTLGVQPSLNAPHAAATNGTAALMLVAVAPALALYGWFLRLLREVVDTVAAGSPFIAANGDRLSRMGWVAVALELLSVAEVGLVHLGADPVMRFGSRFDGPGLLAILVLFILARVFRQGATMREELEGTV